MQTSIEALENRTLMSSSDLAIFDVFPDGNGAKKVVVPNVGTIVMQGGGHGWVSVGADGKTLSLNLTDPGNVFSKSPITIGDVTVSGTLSSFRAPHATLVGALYVGGDINNLVLGSVNGGTIASGGSHIQNVKLGSMTNGFMIAGASPGPDKKLGTADDNYATASIDSLVVKSDIVHSIVVAGTSPGPDGVFVLNPKFGYDISFGGNIGRLTAHRADFSSHFEAETFGVVKLPNKIATPVRSSPSPDYRLVIPAVIA